MVERRCPKQRLTRRDLVRWFLGLGAGSAAASLLATTGTIKPRERRAKGTEPVAAGDRLVFATGANKEVPAAYVSVMGSDRTGFSLIVRRAHNWAANLMIAAGILHLLRVFLTGAFKKPREINWLVGVLLLGVTIFAANSPSRPQASATTSLNLFLGSVALRC